MKTSSRDIKRYQTKDGSLIRELMHPEHQAVKNQSLAEATVPPGVTTHLHRHIRSEELYHITRGQGEMQLDHARFPVAQGDTVLIPPDTPHAITNTGTEDLVILCCCAPAYAHEDTELL
ncbi:MAG: cupin domain-containing protein [Sedimenticola sp.]|nr:cupin domain-containing protein [Sedimenticola sp.]